MIYIKLRNSDWVLFCHSPIGDQPNCFALFAIVSLICFALYFMIVKYFCTTCEALYTTVRMAPQAASFCRSGRIDLLLEQKYELLQSNSRLLGCVRVMETRAECHFSWVYIFSATLSSLRN